MFPKNISTFKTNRLFYGEYLYKLVLSNSLNHYFRTEFQKHERLSHVREKLDELTEAYRKNEPLVRPMYRADVIVPVDDYFDALDLYTILKKQSNYKIRVEQYNVLSLYSNDKNLLHTISQKIRDKKTEFHGPDPKLVNTLLSNKKIILVDKPPQFELKVYFSNKKVDQSFVTWCNANTDKSKIGKRALESARDWGYLNNFYMYIRDERVLNLVSLIIGDNIRSIEKLIYKGDIDK